MTESYVYFAEREELIKIGVTTRLRERLAKLSRGDAMPPGMTVGPVQLIVAVPGNRNDEHRYHRAYADRRIHGTEWFTPDRQMRDALKSLAAYPGAIDGNSLGGRPGATDGYTVDMYNPRLGGRPSAHPDVAAELRTKPGVWGVVRVTDSLKKAQNTATGIRLAYLRPYAPAGSFVAVIETIGSEHHVYAQYVRGASV